MTIEELKSGSYRVTEMYKGKRFRITFDKKPTKKEAKRLLNNKIQSYLDNSLDENTNNSFINCAEQFIELKRNVLSPSTLRAYGCMKRQISDKLGEKNIDDITAVDIQKEINDFAVGHSPKYTRNYHGFLSDILQVYRPALQLRTTLPQKIPPQLHTPVDDDVSKIFEMAKETKFEVPFVLAACGMRRSEILAVTSDDVNGNVLSINKALVIGDDGKWVTKTTKTVSSTRDIVIPERIADLIRQQGCAYDGAPSSIIKALHKYQDALGIERFRLHDLRSYYASTMHALGVPDSYIMQSGGWKTDNVMKRVYRKALEDKKKSMQEIGVSHIEKLLD